MKKFLIFLTVLSVGISAVQAKDYAKMQIKEMKHAQKYGTTKKVLQNEQKNITPVSVSNLDIKDPKIMKFGHYDKIASDKYKEKLKKDEVEYEEYAQQLGKKHSKY